MHQKRASEDPLNSQFHCNKNKKEFLAGTIKIPKNIISPVSKSEKNSPTTIKIPRNPISSPRITSNIFNIQTRRPYIEKNKTPNSSSKIKNFFQDKKSQDVSSLIIRKIPKRFSSPKSSTLKTSSSEKSLSRKSAEKQKSAFFNKEKTELIEAIKKSFKETLNEPPTDDRFYTIEKLLGQGAFGKVLLGYQILTGMKVAIKAIDRSHLENEYSRRKIFREVYILKKLQSKYVVKIVEVFETAENFLIVMEYVKGGDLLNYLKENGRMSEEKCKQIFYQIVLGLNTIHRNGILHRDIKLDNILIDKSKNSIKICDFGVSKLIRKGEVITDQCGTPAYLAPEIILDKGYEGYWSDIWSLGVLLYCMVCGTVPFKANSLQDLHKAILIGKYDLPDYLSANVKHLLKSMLIIVPSKRIPVDKILRHRWFDSCADVYNDLVQDQTSIINQETLAQMENLGYPKQYVVNSLEFKSLNHAFAVYSILNNNSK